jgi:hypothetical protein
MQKKISGALISVFYKDGLEPVVKTLQNWILRYIQPEVHKNLLKILISNANRLKNSQLTPLF